MPIPQNCAEFCSASDGNSAERSRPNRKIKKIQNVANFILICFWSEMVLRIELQTRQYHQNVQNFGAELLKQVLVQQKYAQGVPPPTQQQLQYSLGGVHPPQQQQPLRGGHPPPSTQQQQAISASGGYTLEPTLHQQGGAHPPLGPSRTCSRPPSLVPGARMT